MTPLSWTIVAGLGLINLIAFTAHARDKRAAIRGAERTPESRLHLWELLGGWPGALLAMTLFRHKLRKFSYLLVLGVIILAWAVGISGLAGWMPTGE